MQRRRFIQATGTGIGIGIAGCLGGDGDDGSDGGDGGGDGGDGGGDGGSGGSGDEDLPVVRVGAAAAGSSGVLMDVITGAGIDRDHGVVFEDTRAAPSEVTQLVLNDAVDVGHAAPGQAAAANQQGNNIKAFAPWLANHTALIVEPDSDIESWDDLQGQTVGTLPKPTAAYFHTTLRLAHDDMSFEEDFDVQQAGANVIHTNFMRGDIPAHVHFPPVLIPTVVDGDGRVVERVGKAFEDIYGSNQHFQNVVAFEDWIEGDPDLAQTVQDVFIDAATQMSENPLEHLQADYSDTAAYESEEHFEMAAEWTPAIYPTTWEEEDRQQVEGQIEELKELGHLDEDTPSDITASL